MERGAEVVLERVTKSYGAAVHALVDVSLRVERGELLVIRGPSGSGKSTLLQVVAGFARPDSGSVLVDGKPVPQAGDAPAYRREVVGVVFQSHHLLPALSARVNVEVALLGAGVARAERTRRATELLGQVGLTARSDHMPGQLSGGERQCVAIARALANRPRLLLCDEPTAALDAAAAGRILDLLERLRRENAMTVIAVTHDPAVAGSAERIAEIVDGRLQVPVRPAATG